MNAVDTRFDQAEVYLLRNTFRVPTELIPYLVLPHHPPDGFPPPPFPALPDSEDKEDDALMKELEQEIASTNKLREEILLLDTVQERLDRRVLALKKIKSGLSEILPNGGARGAFLTSEMISHLSDIVTLAQTLSANDRSKQP